MPIGGSGGSNSSISWARRCGWAADQVWSERDTYSLDRALFSPLPGCETVPRAELTAVVAVLAKVPPDVDVELVCDFKLIVDVAKKKPHLCTGGANSDLRETYNYHMGRGAGATTLRWTKAHQTHIGRRQTTLADLAGNELADLLAEQGAVGLQGFQPSVFRMHNRRRNQQERNRD